MSITNDERREVAARLRKYRASVTSHSLTDYIFNDPWRHNCCEDVADRLADLIEPDRDLTCEWVSVDDRLPDCKGEYIVAYHPCCWDNVKYDKVLVGMDSFTGKSSWYRRKYQRVTHWMPKPEPPRAKVVAE